MWAEAEPASEPTVVNTITTNPVDREVDNEDVADEEYVCEAVFQDFRRVTAQLE
jgi:hypothetical protein